MARIEFKWSDPKWNLYDGIDPSNLLASLPDEYKNGEQPVIFFLTSDLTDDAQEMANIDATTLRDEKVAIGATMFKQVKMNGLKVKESHPYWKQLGGKELPRMVVVDSAGQKSGSVEGKDISPSKLFGLMKKAASKTFKTDLDTIVSETKTILTQIDQIEAKRAALETRKASSTVAKTAEWEREEKELAAMQKAVEAREAELKKKWSGDKKVAKA